MGSKDQSEPSAVERVAVLVGDLVDGELWAIVGRGDGRRGFDAEDGGDLGELFGVGEHGQSLQAW
jgi:hypothetical protein